MIFALINSLEPRTFVQWTHKGCEKKFMIVGEFCRLCEIFSKLINEAHVLDFFVKFVGEKNVYKLKLLIGGTEVHIESIILAMKLSI